MTDPGVRPTARQLPEPTGDDVSSVAVVREPFEQRQFGLVGEVRYQLFEFIDGH